MLDEKQWLKATLRQKELMQILNRFAQDLSGEHNLEKIYQMTYHFQDLGYVYTELKNLHDVWFLEGEYNEK